MPFTVYAIINIENGKRYIGKTSQSLRARFRAHLHDARKGKGCRRIKEAILLHGEGAFRAEPLLMTDTDDEALKAEAYFISLFNTQDETKGYNLAAGGRGFKGAKWPEQSKAELSRRMIGNKRSSGVVPSPERRDKVRRALVGHPVSEETRARIRAAMLASPKCRGFKLSNETRAKMAAARLGTQCTPEQRAAISERLRLYNASPERRQQLSEQAKAGWAKIRAKAGN